MANSYIEVRSDGTFQGTKIVLVVESNGAEVRYDLPGVMAAQWSMDAKPNKTSILHLQLQGVQMDARTTIDTRSTSVEDLLTEIAASRLARDKGDGDSGSKFIVGKSATVTIIDADGELERINLMSSDEDLP